MKNKDKIYDWYNSEINKDKIFLDNEKSKLINNLKSIKKDELFQTNKTKLTIWMKLKRILLGS